LGSLGSTYTIHLRLTGKHVVDFLLVLIELFLLGVTAEVLRAKIDWKLAFCKRVRQYPPPFHVEWDVPLPFCHNPRFTDRQMNEQTDRHLSH